MRNKTKWIGVLAGGLLLASAGVVLASGGKIGTLYVADEQNAGPGAIGSAAASGTAEKQFDREPVRVSGSIASVDTENNRVLFNYETPVLDENGAETGETQVQQVLLLVDETTPVVDAASGNPLALSDIKTDQPAYAWHSQMMTRSLPPQTKAELLVVNVPADYAAPQYVVVSGIERNADNGTIVLTDQEGNRWAASAETSTIEPWLTRNIVSLEDLQEGSHCLIWPGEAVGLSLPPLYQAKRIILFA